VPQMSTVCLKMQSVWNLSLAVYSYWGKSQISPPSCVVIYKGHIFNSTACIYGTNFICLVLHSVIGGTAVAQWLRCCATNRKVAGSIPAGVIGIFH